MEESKALQPTNGNSEAVQVVSGDLPVLNIQGIIQFQTGVETIIKSCMREGIHYGSLPGTKSKIMFKPGLDLLCTAGNIIDLYDEPVVFEHEGNHRSYEYTCRLKSMHSEKVVAVAKASASTLESKFRFESYYENQQFAGKKEISADKVYDKHYLVIQVAKTRAKRNAVNAFFNPAGFINEPEPPKQSSYKKPEPQKKEPKPNPVKQKKWNPTPFQLNDPNWYYEEIKKLETHDDIVLFHETFELDEKFFDNDTQAKIKEAYNNRWGELKEKK